MLLGAIGSLLGCSSGHLGAFLGRLGLLGLAILGSPWDHSGAPNSYKKIAFHVNVYRYEKVLGLTLASAILIKCVE